MNAVCVECGDTGYHNLLVYCRGCKDCARHLYCFEKVIFDGSSTNWLCLECQERNGAVTCSVSIDNVSSERSSHAHSDSTLHQPITEEVELENVNPLSQKCDTLQNDNIVEETLLTGDLRDPNSSNCGPAKKGRRFIDFNEDEDEGTNGVEETEQAGDLSNPDASNGVEETGQTGDLSNSGASNEGIVKKRRRYKDVNDDEDEEAVIDVANASSPQNDVVNSDLNGGLNANLAPQTPVANDLLLRFRMASDSDSADQQHNIYPGPIDEPVWSGTFKVNNEVSGKLDAHLSNKASQKVWAFSRMLQPEVEVKKIARLQAWPKSFRSAPPTAYNIGFFFFPHSSRPNEQANKLVNELIESDEALKVTIGVVKLLIFPSTVLREQDQLFQGKYYLWGLCKTRKDKTDRAVPAGEQDGVLRATEENNLEEQQVLYQQDDTRCESTGHETPVHEEVNQQGQFSFPVLTASNAESLFASIPSNADFIGVVKVRTPRTLQLLEEMVREGVVAFSVPEGTEVTISGIGTIVGGSGLNPDTSHQHLGEDPKPFDLISRGHDVPDVDSPSCLELFPVSQENIGWAPRVQETKEVDLDLSLGASSRAPPPALL